MLDYAQARRTMVDCQLRTFDVVDIALLSAMDQVPRERFVPPGREDLAYSDQPIVVSDGVLTAEPRAMLSPMVAARLIQSLAVAPGSRVLDVACGLGYSAAIMARLGGQVVALDTSEDLVAAARSRLSGEPTILEIRAGPLAEGVQERAPYDSILINGLVEQRPEALLDQLAESGRLACVQKVGSASRAMLYVRSGDAFGSRPLFEAQAAALAEFRTPAAFVF